MQRVGTLHGAKLIRVKVIGGRAGTATGAGFGLGAAGRISYAVVGNAGADAAGGRGVSLRTKCVVSNTHRGAQHAVRAPANSSG